MAVIEGQKTCTKCYKTKPLSEFFRNGTTSSGKVRYRSCCKDCFMRYLYKPEPSNKKVITTLKVKQLPEAVRSMAESQYKLSQIDKEFKTKMSRLENFKNDSAEPVIARINFIRRLIKNTLEKSKRLPKSKKWRFRFGVIEYDGQVLKINLKTKLAGECLEKP